MPEDCSIRLIVDSLTPAATGRAYCGRPTVRSVQSFDFRSGSDRPVTRTDWLESRHSFSFGSHYEPDNTHFGLLLAHNEDRLQPGTGFAMHEHRDTEILTWVLDGQLTHEDSTGRRELVEPATIQLLSAGSAVQHAESNARTDRPLHLVQMWLQPTLTGGSAYYARADVAAALAAGGWVCLASGQPSGPALPLKQPGAALWVARLPAGAELELPTGRYLHVFAARGELAVTGSPRLSAGDALRITGSDDDRLTALTDCEVLAWQLDSALR